jgi:Clp protease
MPSTRIMMHQPAGGAMGSADEVNIQASELNRTMKVTPCPRPLPSAPAAVLTFWPLLRGGHQRLVRLSCSPGHPPVLCGVHGAEPGEGPGGDGQGQLHEPPAGHGPGSDRWRHSIGLFAANSIGDTAIQRALLTDMFVHDSAGNLCGSH